MSKSRRDGVARKVRQFNREFNKKADELGLTGFRAEDVNPELNEMFRELRNAQVYLPDSWRSERRHSAAHRHSSIKTRKRCGRSKKHAEKQFVQKEINEDS